MQRALFILLTVVLATAGWFLLQGPKEVDSGLDPLQQEQAPGELVPENLETASPDLVHTPSTEVRTSGSQPVPEAQPKKAALPMTVTVLDVLGQPISDVSVSWDRTWFGALEKKTDAAGQCTLDAILAGKLKVNKPGYIVLYLPQPVAEPVAENRSGLQCTVWMTPLAELTVWVLDAQGEPVAGETLSIGPDPCEYTGASEGYAEWLKSHTKKPVSDAAGRVWYFALPSHQRLRISTETGLYSRLGGANASTLMAAGGVPLRLLPGENREVFLRKPGKYELRGEIVEPDGKPSVGAIMNLWGLPSNPADEMAFITSGRPQADGSFSIPVELSDPTQVVMLLADSRVGAEPTYSPFGGTKWPDPRKRCWQVLSVSELHQPLSLVMQPMNKIEGRVRNTAGEPVSAELGLTPVGGPWYAKFLLQGLVFGQPHRETGEFVFKGLPKGRYDVTFSHLKYERHTESAVWTGTRDLDLTMKAGAYIRMRYTPDKKVPVADLGDLQGQVGPLPIDSDWHVALALTSGELIQLRRPDWSRTKTVAISTSGRFLLPGLPPGKLELRLGPSDMLLNGGAEIRASVVIPKAGLAVWNGDS